MITGNYHSGPVQTIRTTGYFGLIILMGAMIYAAILAHRLIIRCRGTDWYPVALFFGLGSIVRPFMFTFVFGTFEDDFASTIISLGLLSLFHKNLPPDLVPAAQRVTPRPAFKPAWAGQTPRHVGPFGGR